MSPSWPAIGTVALGDDLTVRRVGFGGAWLTGPGTYGPPPDLDAARAIVRRAVDEGFQLIDTADCYGPAPASPARATEGRFQCGGTHTAGA
ncbi:MAG: hypothetical protein GEU88_14350 [Solirubrobacterales bacterium]|nr:hypothetical protein [Solirubrobacterales bacterium]